MAHANHPPAAWLRGLAAYRARRFFEAHEHWEELWRAETDPERRLCLQALIQLAAALHKLTTGIRPNGAPALLERAADKLQRVSAPCWGIDPADLAPHLRALRAEALRALSSGGATRDAARAPPLTGGCHEHGIFYP